MSRAPSTARIRRASVPSELSSSGLTRWPSPLFAAVTITWSPGRQPATGSASVTVLSPGLTGAPSFTQVREGGARSDAVRHPLEALHPATRAGLLELAGELKPLALRWGK